MMLSIAITIGFYPHTISHSSFHYMLALGFEPEFLLTSFIVFGFLRGLALYVNGYWRLYGPLLRAIGCVGGAFLWFTFALSLWQTSYDTGVISLGVPVYTCLMIGEIISVLRAGTDVRPRKC